MRQSDILPAWDDHPGYRIDLEPVPQTVRVAVGDTVVCESVNALRVVETDHVHRIYVPRDEVDFSYFTPNDHESVCPFKGLATYWTFVAASMSVDDVLWTYADPFPQVAGLAGHLGVYHEVPGVSVTLLERWPGDSPERGALETAFPDWGDISDLVEVMDVRQTETTHGFIAPGYVSISPFGRNVVEAGQLVGQAIVAASRTLPDQRVISVSMLFPKAARFDAPVDLSIETLRSGRTLSTLEVRTSQGGRLCGPALVMLDGGSDGVICHTAAMPDVPGPLDCPPLDMGVTGREIRVVDGAYSPDPDLVGPPVIHIWVRFRDCPPETAMQQALMAQATGHWTIAAAMRPHAGVGEAQAHRSLSTAVVGIHMDFHDEADISNWILYTNPSPWSGRGLALGQGQIFTHEGVLAATYDVQSMIRPSDPSIGPQRDSSTVM